MPRILIVNNDDIINKKVVDCLDEEFCVKIIQDGEDILAHINEMDPDVLLVDLQLRRSNAEEALRTIRLAGKNIVTIVLTSSLDENNRRNLCGMLGKVLIKPATAARIAETIHEGYIKLQQEKNSGIYLENELDQLLQDLSFHIGTERYNILRCALLVRINAPDDVLLKEIYSDVMRKMNAQYTMVEKSVRDAIRIAWEQGNRSCWDMYFMTGFGKMSQRPKSEEFLTRIAVCMQKGGRLHRPFEQDVMYK